MKALTIWQPWASLIACGAKRIETRHWPAPPAVVGQRIAIHAARTRAHLDIALDPRYAAALRRGTDAGIHEHDALPFGAIVATAILASCDELTYDDVTRLQAEDPDEHAFGWYLPHRFAWRLEHVRPVLPPIPTIGRQGLYDVDDPEADHRG